MAKKRNRSKTGRCVLCSTFSDNLTNDHLLPKAWYASWTPENFYKQTFPSCYPCNTAHGQSEERLLRSLGMSLDETSVAGAGISQKVIHSMSLTDAPNERESEIRGRIKLKFLRDCREIDPNRKLDGLGLLPGLHFNPETVASGRYTVCTISGADVKRFAEKIVRGVLYLEYQLFVEKSQEVRIFPEKQDFIEQFANHHVLLPGLRVSFGPLPSEDMPAVVFELNLWDILTMHAVCMPREERIWKERVFRLVEIEPLWDIESQTYETTTANPYGLANGLIPAGLS